MTLSWSASSSESIDDSTAENLPASRPSAPQRIATAIAAAQSKTPSLLRKVAKDELDSKKVYDAAVEGDELAKGIFEYTGKILGMALANFVMFSSPEAIILFGGLTKAGELILKPTREHMEANLIQVFQNKVKILVSHLKESDAAILGASALVWELK